MMVRRLGFESSFFPASASDSDDVLLVALAPAAVHLAATVTRATATNQALTARRAAETLARRASSG